MDADKPPESGLLYPFWTNILVFCGNFRRSDPSRQQETRRSGYQKVLQGRGIPLDGVPAVSAKAGAAVAADAAVPASSALDRCLEEHSLQRVVGSLCRGRCGLGRCGGHLTAGALGCSPPGVLVSRLPTPMGSFFSTPSSRLPPNRRLRTLRIPSSIPSLAAWKTSSEALPLRIGWARSIRRAWSRSPPPSLANLMMTLEAT